MTDDKKLVDGDALNGIGVAPPNPGGDEGQDRESASESPEGSEADLRASGLTGQETHYAQMPGQHAGQDRSLGQRLREHPQDDDAKVDVGSDESMDASDPVAAAQPGSGEPVPSSGYQDLTE